MIDSEDSHKVPRHLTNSETPNENLEDLALRTGFYDAKHLKKEFANVCGKSAVSFRENINSTEMSLQKAIHLSITAK